MHQRTQCLFACERCHIKGKWNGRVVFSIRGGIDAPELRTDARLNNFKYRDHQVELSPLVDVGVSCIKSFPHDYMHLVCLGVVKRILMFLKSSPRECRLSHQQIQTVSDHLMSLNGKIPREFARQLRSLYYLDRWKATELRQFLLYTGPPVLQNVLSDQDYCHFLLITVAMSILLSSNEEFRSVHLAYTKERMVYFVKNSVHSLIHICDDAKNFEVSLNDICAFQFEKTIYKNLKKKC